MESRAGTTSSRVVDDIVGGLIDRYCPEEADPADWESAALANEYRVYFAIAVDSLGVDWAAVNRPDLERRLADGAKQAYLARVERFSAEEFERLERFLLLDTVDRQWKDTCSPSTTCAKASGCARTANATRSSSTSGSRTRCSRRCGSGSRITSSSSCTTPSRSGLPAEAAGPADCVPPSGGGRSCGVAPAAGAGGQHSGRRSRAAGDREADPAKVGRNDPCPCGSGKKYKRCCGVASEAGR